jgi:hypothetical protein
MPTVSRPRSSVLGTRPTASSTRSHSIGVAALDLDGALLLLLRAR